MFHRFGGAEMFQISKIILRIKVEKQSSFKVVRNVENFVCHFCYIFIYHSNKSTDHFNTKNIYITRHE